MPFTDLSLRPVYNHGNCPDMLAGLYEPLLEQAVRYDRTTYTFTANGLIAAATGTAGLIRNGGRIRLICDHSVHEDVLHAIHDGQLDAETALQQTARREDLLLTETADIADRNHLELAYWLVANGIMEVKVAIRGDRIFHNKSGIVEDAQGNRVAFAGSLNETLSGWRHNWESVHVYTDGATIQHLEATEAEFQALWTNQAGGLRVIDLPAYYRDYIVERAPASPPRLDPFENAATTTRPTITGKASTTLSLTTPTARLPPYLPPSGRTRSVSAGRTFATNPCAV